MRKARFSIVIASLVATLILLWLASGGTARAVEASLDARALARVQFPPLGLPGVPVPIANRLTLEKISLGRKLFLDRRLSHNRTMSCAMCHIPEQGFSNNELATPVGVKGRSLRRNAPASFNVAYLRTIFHDARDTTLENQVLGPFLARDEMANPSIGYLLTTIREAPDYAGLFETAFGQPVNVINLGQAIASYERTLVSGNSPFDRWHFGGDDGAVSEQVKQGFQLFAGKAGCTSCHLLGDDHALFTDHGLHNTGIGYSQSVAKRTHTATAMIQVELLPGMVVPMRPNPVARVGEPTGKDLGRMGITNDPKDLYSFKTPMLRNVALTAPYMHDGSLRTLGDVVRFYRDGGHANPGLDPLIKPLPLNEDEITALVTFLESLTGDNVAELVTDARSVPIGN